MDLRPETGMALLLVTLALILVSALGTALVLTTSTEVMIAGNYRSSIEARYAAEAVAERAMDELAAQVDWQPILDGALRSTFTDGEPSGLRQLSDGTPIDLTAARQRIAGGQLYAYGFFDELAPGLGHGPSLYLMAVVGPSSGETGRLRLIAEAVGARGIRRAVELVVALNDDTEPTDGLRVLSWHALR